MADGYRDWKILVVDDEPDVLEVTKLAMRDVTVMGIPINIMTAGSMAEAKELTKGNDTLNLVFAFNYGSRREISEAAQRLAARAVLAM